MYRKSALITGGSRGSAMQSHFLCPQSFLGPFSAGHTESVATPDLAQRQIECLKQKLKFCYGTLCKDF